MIELVFVIVILGILASVAIPKLAATRDDAKIASKASEIQAAISEIPAYVTAQGKVDSLKDMSQVLAQLVNQGKATESNNGKTLTLHSQDGSNTDDVIVMDVNNTTLKVSYANAACGGVICTQLRKRIAEGNYTIGGTSISF
jgi:type II secretory pathway pseudopilin PulG